jgi:putative DNA methylase
LGLVVGRAANYWSSLTPWSGEFIVQTFGRQALAMVWDFAEANPFSNSTGSWRNLLDGAARAVERAPAQAPCTVRQLDATHAVNGVEAPMICTDPPYYDNIGYADLADYFYIWLRRSLRGSFPDLFSTLLTPKSQELVATPHRFDESKDRARAHFESGLRAAFERMREAHSPEYPLSLFYAFKQAEVDSDGLASTGWETMLEGLIGSQLMVTGTWPMRTERDQGLKTGASVLASSIVLVCRPRPKSAALATRKEFTAALRQELPDALHQLQSGSVAPVDLAQAAIGPGMAIFSRYSKVMEADGKPMRVRTALTLINEALDELLAEQEADFDADTRWCVAWFEQHGMNEGPFGSAETLSRAKNTAINGLVDAGVVHSRGGKVRLLDRIELESTWNPAADQRLTVWEVTQHLITRHQTDGEAVAADLLREVGGGLAEAARELAYRLFSICERKGWAHEALAYNALVTAWPEITRLAAQATEVGAGGDQEAMEI